MKVDHICKDCGEHQTGSWTDGEELQTAQQCRTCHFWTGYVDGARRKDIARIDGKHYVVGPKLPSSARSSDKGHAGRRFVIRFFDERGEITTDNLWYQGEIPERFRDKLPDNAEFLPDTKFGMMLLAALPLDIIEEQL